MISHYFSSCEIASLCQYKATFKVTVRHILMLMFPDNLRKGRKHFMYLIRSKCPPQCKFDILVSLNLNAVSKDFLPMSLSSFTLR